MHDYQRLRVWQAARDLAVDTYRFTESFPRHEIFGMTSQLRRSASSIAANIAEGAGRSSNRELVRYLRISAGSASEYETHVTVASAVGLLDQEVGIDVLHQVDSIKRMLHKLEASFRST